ncbi:class I SAM-dependent methyltransferase [Micromonospora sp. WMMD1082]|uniref:class I SAM-dependent methyltransferase n=1 Tax=Micromonospora sp. WMMD1082 TaxID=3016104 RepID=UPI002417E7A9|nr:class I SAM-dependent methyltransferase [Micromonospora sp. WMMD1082]MDG4795533.1 class I SAM-dependent methyltransferase [Micromonospora sp. WMMD1082]
MNSSPYTLEWDYTKLASTYSLRPEYAPAAIDRIVGACGDHSPVTAADIGAGTGHLTLDLLARGCLVDAVEPNDAMRAIGIERTADHAGVTWSVGIGEETGLPSRRYHLVTYGSSFSNTDQPKALHETARILASGGWFACIWNHRELDDPIQAEVEELIHQRVPQYAYGRRRQDHAPVIRDSRLFGSVEKIEEPVQHRVSITDWIIAWRSHATLQRQAGDDFHPIVDDIERLVRSRVDGEHLDVPYLTVGWLAQLRDEQ